MCYNDVLNTRGRPKMHFSYSAENEKAENDQNSPFSAPFGSENENEFLSASIKYCSNESSFILVVVDNWRV